MNSETPDAEGSIQYDSFMSAAAVLKASGKGLLLAKLDLKDAYRHIPVWSSDWNLLGFPLAREILLPHCANVQQ